MKLEEERIQFLGFLRNADPSSSKAKLRHGFKIEVIRPSELVKLPSSPRTRNYLNRVINDHVRHIGTDQDALVTNTFHAWGNEEGYFSDYIPDGPERDDAFLVPDYLEPVIRLMRLFKEGDISLSAQVHLDEGGELLRSSESSRSFPFPGLKYFLTDAEVPQLQKLLGTGRLPFSLGYIELAFDFFELSYDTNNLALKFLVLMIGIEALLNPGYASSITRKLTKNVSNLLGVRTEDKERISSEMRALFKKRGALVHQGLHDYGSYLTSVAPDFDKLSQNQRESGDPSSSELLGGADVVRARNYLRSSIVKAAEINLSKEKLVVGLCGD